MRKKISILLLGIMLMQNTTTCVGVYAADTDTTEDTTKEAPAFLQDQRSFPGSEERKKQENESRSTIDTSMSSTQEVTPSSSSKSKEDSDMTQFSNSNEKNVTKTEIKDKLVTANWQWSHNGNVITLQDYVGTSKDVLIPTARDLGRDGAEVHISSAVLKDAAQGATSITTSTNGNQIKVAPVSTPETQLYSTFKDNITLEKVVLNNLDITNVTEMSSMFSGCRNLSTVDLSNFNTTNITHMEYMFRECPSLTTVDLSSFVTPNLKYMSGMFLRSPNIVTIDLSNFNMANVIDSSYVFSVVDLFIHAPLLVKTKDAKLKNYDYASDNRTKMGMLKIDPLDGTIGGQTSTSLFDYTTDQDLTEELVNRQLEVAKERLQLKPGTRFSNWEPEGNYQTLLEKMQGTYTVKTDLCDWQWSQSGNVITLEDYIGSSKDVLIPTARDLGQDGAEVQINSNVLLDAAQGATSIKTSINGDPIKVSDNNLGGVFYNCNTLKTVVLNNLDTSNVTNMVSMFLSCTNLESIDLSNFDTKNVTDMNGMFAKCTNLESIDLSSFDTQNVTDIRGMFGDCYKLTSIDLSSFDTQNVTNMSYMFDNCYKLTSIDLSSFDTQNVTNMSYMFDNCSKLTSIDLSNFNTSQLSHMQQMFSTSAPIPLLVKTTDTKLKNYDYASDRRTKMGTVKIDPLYGTIGGQASTSLFDYTTDQDLTEELVNHQLELAKEKLQLKPGAHFYNWEPESNYQSFLEKAQGTYSVKAEVFDWQWSQNGNVITLEDYVGASKDVLIPTAKDLGQEGAEVQISSAVLKDAAQGATSIKTSTNGAPIIVSDHSFDSVFEKNQTLETVTFNNLNTTNVTNAKEMFFDCSNLKRVDLSSFDTSNMTNLYSMFSTCPNLTSVDLSSFNTTNVTDMSFMFYSCTSLTTLDLSSFNTSKIVPQNMYGAFWSTTYVPLLIKTTDPQLKNYDYASSNRTKMGTVKIDAAYGTIDGQASTSLFDYTTDQDLTDELVNQQLEAAKGKLQLKPGAHFYNWEPEGNYQTFLEKAQGTYSVKAEVFDWQWSQNGNVITLEDYIGTSKDVLIPTAKDLGQDGAEVQISSAVLTDAAQGATSITTSTNGDQIKVSDASLETTFYQNETLKSITFNNLDVSNVKNMNSMFYKCNALEEIDLSSFGTNNVTDMSYMFAECSNLNKVNLNSFDTTYVTDMNSMFMNCSQLITIDLSNFDTSYVIDMNSMFRTDKTIPLLVKTSDNKLKNYDYANDSRTKMGTVKIDAQYGSFAGEQSLSLFDYTTDQDLTDELVTRQLEEAKKKLTLESTTQFDSWSPEGSYATFLEKAQGIYTVKVMIVPDCSVVVPTSYKLTDAKTYAKAKVKLIDNKTQKEYTGKLKAGITVSSKQKFKLGTEQEISSGTAGEYQLVDEQKNPLNLSSGIQLDGNKTEQALNVLLTKENKEGKIGSDILSFEYQLTMSSE
ncbi:DUF285 domain-containing protein [Enterococcus hirae]|nr:DUF285 domain-containing protein [Enterococcus hirae]